MLTLKLKIKNKIDVTEYCENYSYMFRKLYANFELSEDKGFRDGLRQKYNLDAWLYDSCCIAVKGKLALCEAIEKKRKAKLEVLEKNLLKATNSSSKFKIKRNISEIKKNKRKVVFGGKTILRKISYLSNTDKEEAKKWKDAYNKNRILPISIVGETAEKSNRKFDFDLCNKKVVFKPKFRTNIPVEFYCSDGQLRQISQLQEQVGQQPIFMRLNNDYVWITFDEQKLNGYATDEISKKRELAKIPKEQPELRKECRIRWHKEREARQLIGKIETRIIAFDLNPEYIGVCIMDGDKNIFKQVIDLSKLSNKMGLSTTDPKQIKQNNKRKHEIKEVWKYIFKVASHYKVAKCAVEEFEFREKGINEESSKGNRKIKNIWHRTMTNELINKYCNINGIELIEIRPEYSSFVGNIRHNYFDPLNSALEIGRRGQVQYLNGGFYPPLERIDLDTMCQLGLDVPGKTISRWIDAYRLFKTLGLRYRRELGEYSSFLENNLQSYKSNTLVYSFM